MNMVEVFGLLLLFATYTLVKGRVPREPTTVTFAPDFTCCYGNILLKHGGVALTLPECCLQLVCSFGQLHLKHVGNPGDTFCCEFNGQLYPPNYELNHCIPLSCEHGRWVHQDHIDDCCRHCALYNDPHFKTFDGHHYDWHDDCNYTVTQRHFSFSPDIGVFSNFDRCWGGASCLDRTTFRNDPHTIITLRNGAVFNILVNGDPFTVSHNRAVPVTSSSGPHPVLVWRDKEHHCLMILGSSRLVLQHCHNRLDIWAHPSHADNLDGLCGHYNFYVRDDFTDRQGIIHELQHYPSEFPLSWKTNDQNDPHCKNIYTLPYESPKGNPCHLGEEKLKAFITRCRNNLAKIIGRHELQYLIDACAFDLCMMHQNGENSRTMEEWIRELIENARIAKDNLIKIKGKKEPHEVHAEQKYGEDVHPRQIVSPFPVTKTEELTTSVSPNYDSYNTSLPRLTDVHLPVSPQPRILAKAYTSIVTTVPVDSMYTGSPVRSSTEYLVSYDTREKTVTSPTTTLYRTATEEHVTTNEP